MSDGCRGRRRGGERRAIDEGLKGKRGKGHFDIDEIIKFLSFCFLFSLGFHLTSVLSFRFHYLTEVDRGEDAGENTKENH